MTVLRDLTLKTICERPSSNSHLRHHVQHLGK